jgi:hypothetical protein
MRRTDANEGPQQGNAEEEADDGQKTAETGNGKQL